MNPLLDMPQESIIRQTVRLAGVLQAAGDAVRDDAIRLARRDCHAHSQAPKSNLAPCASICLPKERAKIETHPTNFRWLHLAVHNKCGQHYSYLR